MRAFALAPVAFTLSIPFTLSILGVAGCDPAPASSSPGRPDRSTAPSQSTVVSAPRSTVPVPPSRPRGPRVITEKDYTGVILPYDYPWKRGRERWAPDAIAVAEAEHCISRDLSKMKASPAYQAGKLPEIVKALKEYRRQYLGFTNEQGRDLLWVNFFRDPGESHKDWKTSLVTVKGGGQAYFNVTADVAGGTCGELRINSPR
jgi:hypothetical protein